MALAATVDMLPEDDCASRVLPAICPALIDKEKRVDHIKDHRRKLTFSRIIRGQAVKTMEIYMARLRNYSETMPASALPVQSSVNQNGGPVPAEVAAGSADPGWAGWAISSFTSKVTETMGQIEPAANGGLIPPSATGTPDPSRPSTAMASSSQTPTALQTLREPLLSSLNVVGKNEQPPIVLNVDDGWGFDDAHTEADEAWGTMDDDDETFFDTSAKPAAMKPQAKAPPSTDANGEPDFAAWLAAKQATTSIKKGPLPKGLSTAPKPLVPKAVAPIPKPMTRPASSIPARSVLHAAAPRIPAISTTVKPTATKNPMAQKGASAAATKAKDEDDGWGDAWD